MIWNILKFFGAIFLISLGVYILIISFILMYKAVKKTIRK